MQVDGRGLRDHVVQQTGIALREAASGWKGHCPFEPKSPPDSFLVFNSPEGDFYCFSCKAKGGIEEFDKLWNRVQEAKRRRELQERQVRESATAAAKPSAESEPSGVSPWAPVPNSEQQEAAAAPMTRRDMTAALVESLGSQLAYMQRQNEGLHGLVLKYNNMVIGSRQLLLDSKELLLADNDEKHRLEAEVRVQQSRISELERQLDRWRVVKSEVETFIETLEEFTHKLRVEIFK